jgi:hypothetical protein
MILGMGDVKPPCVKDGPSLLSYLEDSLPAPGTTGDDLVLPGRWVIEKALEQLGIGVGPEVNKGGCAQDT